MTHLYNGILYSHYELKWNSLKNGVLLLFDCVMQLVGS